MLFKFLNKQEKINLYWNSLANDTQQEVMDFIKLTEEFSKHSVLRFNPIKLEDYKICIYNNSIEEDDWFNHMISCKRDIEYVLFDPQIDEEELSEDAEQLVRLIG